MTRNYQVLQNQIERQWSECSQGGARAGAVAGVLFDGDSPSEMVARLLSRDPREETL